MEAPVCTIIPGEPEYLPGKSKEFKMSTAMALLEANESNFKTILGDKKSITPEDMRLYDFKNNYNEYMKYVNILCRTGACFLDLDTILTCNGYSESLKSFDWRKYKWSKMASQSVGSLVSGTFNGIGSMFKMETSDEDVGELNEVLTNYSFVQFYIDPDVSPSDSLSNSTGQSMFKSFTDSGSGMMKDLAFMANSGGVDYESLQTFTEGAAASLQEGVSSIIGLGSTNVVSSALSRIINLGSNVLSGHNIIIPDIYQNSEYKKSYSITVHLKTPYGNKLGYYLDIFVPMMHLLALAMPRQESANTFSSPFLVKAYVDGVFTCNLGLVESIQINKTAESWSTSGLPSEVDVTLNIADLYSDLMMSPSTDPIRFMNNSSLIEYLATNCGLSLTSPNIGKKLDFAFNNWTNQFTDIPKNISGAMKEKALNFINDVFKLY